MKKAIATMGILLTMAATAITGTATGTTLPVSAAARPIMAESWDIDDDYDDYDGYDDYNESWDIEDDYDHENMATVRGTKNYLALRSRPSYSDSNIIGRLYNGDVVIVTSHWSGDYVKVYSPDYDCYGWVNGNYLYN